MHRILAAAALVAVGCGGHPAPVTPPDMAFVPAFAPHSDVDILFVIADFALAPVHNEVRNRFPQLIAALDAGPPASYHIGVITADLGTGPFTYNQGQCHPGGDDAKLQVAPARGGNVTSGCSGFSLSGGARYIDYDRIGGTSNIVGVPDVPTAFACMASVGDAGCAYFQSLEAAYHAVSTPPAENAGFLRDGALLVIVFVQDTDDCSAPPDSPLFDRSSDPLVEGSFTPMRCAHVSIACGNPATPIRLPGGGGPFDDCRPRTQAEGSQLYDVQRYIDFFARPGGAKADPSDVILASIVPPPAPFRWQVNQACFPNKPCPNLDHSCISPANVAFFGDPTVRLSAVVDTAVTKVQHSLCDTDYSPAMAGVAQQIIARLR